MTFWYRHRKIILGILISILFIGGLIFYYIDKSSSKKKVEKKKEVVVEKKITKKKKLKEKEDDLLKVDIKGEINKPGIYSAKENSRVIDIINMAEGLTENADTTVINLSKKIEDEMVIIIYSKEEVSNFTKTKEKEKVLNENCKHPENTDLTNDACIDYENNNISDTGIININKASLEELMKLPGIGESKAKSIISYREKNNGFNSIEEIKKVEGIGDNLYAQIEKVITIE